MAVFGLYLTTSGVSSYPNFGLLKFRLMGFYCNPESNIRIKFIANQQCQNMYSKINSWLIRNHMENRKQNTHNNMSAISLSLVKKYVPYLNISYISKYFPAAWYFKLNGTLPIILIF